MSLRFFVLGLAVVAMVAPALAQDDFSNVEIKTTKVADGLYMLEGAGGNLGVSVGDDGVFLIDDQYAPLTERIVAAVRQIDDGPIRFVLNTHWHSDHTGGNENLGKAGALIVAHDNVRQRMSVEQFFTVWDRKVPPSPDGALPVVTFSESVTFHVNGDEIHAFHVDPAHTDGDSMVHFRNANVLHMGDILFNGGYPFIDVDAGGSIRGMIAACDRALELTDADTRIIAGHGPMAVRRDLEAYRAMLQGVVDAVAPLVAQGKSLDEIKRADPLAALDETWGSGFVSPDLMLSIVVRDLAR
jgi:glyoxylase-like metal-dependent hydrolase (beta-lactamase superfamily II)